MEKLDLVPNPNNEVLTALVCNHCKTYVGMYHYYIMDKLDDIGALILENTE